MPIKRPNGNDGGDDYGSTCSEAAVAPVTVPQEQLVEVEQHDDDDDGSPRTTRDVSSNESTLLLHQSAPSYSSTSYPFVGRRQYQQQSASGNKTTAPRILKPSRFKITPANLHPPPRDLQQAPTSTTSRSSRSYRKSFSIGNDSFYDNDADPYGQTSSQYKNRQALLKRLSYGLLTLVCAVYAIAMSRGHEPRTHAPHVHHDHTIPTLLGVRHHNHGHFINALHSGLYASMKSAVYHNTRKERMHAFDTYGQSLRGTSGAATAGGTAGQPKITVDRGSVSFDSPLTVTWNGHRHDRHGYATPLGDKDVIALYCPADETNPTKFRDAARLADARRTTEHMLEKEDGERVDIIPDNQWRIGSFPTIREETCEFRLWLREDHRDRKTGEHQYTLAATTGPFFVKHGSTTPTSLHLALGNQPSDMVVSFATGAQGTPVVQYGTKQNKLHHTARGKSTTYTADELCQAPANMTEPGKFVDPGMLHHVTVPDLVPDTEYYYRVGVERLDSDGNIKNMHWSDVSKFTSSPRVGANGNGDKPYKYVVYADQGAPGYGAKDGSRRITRWARREVEENGIRAVHHFGDLSYANGAGHMWDAWTDMVSNFARRVPLMVGVGNHEYDHDGGGDAGRDPSGLPNSDGFQPEWGNFGHDSAGECGVPTSRRFKMPAEKSGGNGVYWYSFDHGLVHTIMISSEHDLSPGSEQFKWLERDLMLVDRTMTPFLIVESHRPLYNSEDVPANTVVSLAMRDEIEDLLVEHNVDIMLAGHYHAYLRTCGGLYQSKCNNGGPVHFTIGSAGAELDQYPLYEQDWTQVFLKEWGYGRITVHNRTALQFEFVADEDGKVRDEYWVHKDE